MFIWNLFWDFSDFIKIYKSISSTSLLWTRYCAVIEQWVRLNICTNNFVQMIIDISFSSDHKIARLCGSLSEYSGIDPVKDSLLMNKFGDLFLDYPQDTSHHSF